MGEPVTGAEGPIGGEALTGGEAPRGAEALPGTHAHSTRGAFVKRTLISMFIAVPAVKALAFPEPASASVSAGDLGTQYVDCYDQPCQWTELGTGTCCCFCGGFWCGPKRACFDPWTGTICACACGNCVCSGLVNCFN